MSKIDDMLKQLCPNGVEFKELKDSCDVLRGKRLIKSQLSSEYKYPVFHGSLEPLGYFNEKNRDANKVLVVNTGSVGDVGWCDREFWSSDGCFTIKTPDSIDDKFLYYYLKTQERQIKSETRTGGVPTISRETIERIRIPVPPLDIQREIVKILDKFTELEAELEARKKQYAFYRDKLLSFKDFPPPPTAEML